MKRWMAGCWLIVGCWAGWNGCDQKPAAPASSSSGSSPLTAPVDYLGAVDKGKKFATKKIDLATLNQAIQLFHTAEDRFPTDLNELVKERYLAEVPTPPAGSRIAYDPATGKVKIVPQ